MIWSDFEYDALFMVLSKCSIKENHVLDASWAVLGRVLGRLGGLLGRLKVVLESPWGRLGGVLGRLGGVLGGLGNALGASWGRFDPLRAGPRTSWDV